VGLARYIAMVRFGSLIMPSLKAQEADNSSQVLIWTGLAEGWHQRRGLLGHPLGSRISHSSHDSSHSEPKVARFF